MFKIRAVLHYRDTHGILQRTCLLCHSFMHTIQMYFRFFTVEILEPEWNVLEVEVAKAQDVDRVIEVHKQFVSRVCCFLYGLFWFLVWAIILLICITFIVLCLPACNL